MSDVVASSVDNNDTKTGGADTILAEIFRGMKHSLNVSEALFNAAVEKFSMRTADADTAKKVLGAKSNFISALGKSTMTFKTLHRGILILGARKYTLTVTGKRKDGCYASSSRVIEISKDDFVDSKDEEISILLLDMFKELNHLSLENTKDFANLFEDYADLIGIGDDNVSRASERASIKKDLFKSKKLSWKNFVKGLLFLGFTEFDVVIAINHRSGKNTIHSRKIILFEGDE